MVMSKVAVDTAALACATDVSEQGALSSHSRVGFRSSTSVRGAGRIAVSS